MYTQNTYKILEDKKKFDIVIKLFNFKNMAFIQIRIDEDEKKQAQEIFDAMGMSLSGAVKLFIRKTIQEQKIPFEVVAVVKKKKRETIIFPSIEDNSSQKFTNFVRKTF